MNSANVINKKNMKEYTEKDLSFFFSKELENFISTKYYSLFKSQILKFGNNWYGKILDLFISDVNLYIPPYQRGFSWNKNNIERLIDTIERQINESKNKQSVNTLFFGNIHFKKGVTKNSYEIIDGQQRITFIYILLIVLNNFNLSLSNSEMHKDYFITNELGSKKLKHFDIDVNNYLSKLSEFKFKDDSSAFDEKMNLLPIKKYMENNNVWVSDLYLIRDCYDTLHKWISKKYENDKNILLTVFEQLDYLDCIFLLKGDNEDPNLVFNNVNSFSKPMALSQLFKNYLLSQLPFEMAEDVNNTLWNQIELSSSSHFNGIESLTEDFIKHFISTKKHSNAYMSYDYTDNDLYYFFTKKYRELLNNSKMSVIDFAMKTIDQFFKIAKVNDKLSNFVQNYELIIKNDNEEYDFKFEIFTFTLFARFKFSKKYDSSVWSGWSNFLGDLIFWVLSYVELQFLTIDFGIKFIRSIESTFVKYYILDEDISISFDENSDFKRRLEDQLIGIFVKLNWNTTLSSLEEASLMEKVDQVVFEMFSKQMSSITYIENSDSNLISDDFDKPFDFTNYLKYRNFYFVPAKVDKNNEVIFSNWDSNKKIMKDNLIKLIICSPKRNQIGFEKYVSLFYVYEKSGTNSKIEKIFKDELFLKSELHFNGSKINSNVQDTIGNLYVDDLIWKYQNNPKFEGYMNIEEIVNIIESNSERIIKTYFDGLINNDK